jgi:outer membrane protein assembly factor BamB
VTRAVSSMPRLLLAAIAASIALSGCGSNKPKIPALPELKAATPIRALWRTSVGRAEDGAFVPAIVGDSIYVAGADGGLAKLDAATGREQWRVRPLRGASAGVGANANIVVYGSARGEVVAMNATDGKTLWQSRVSSEVQGAPLVLDDLVIARSGDARLFALDARDGKRRWLFQRTAPALTVRAPAVPVGQGGLVYAGFAGGKLAALATGNGGLRWEATVSNPKGATELERVSDVVGAPWLSEREICAVSFQGRAACFDTNTGTSLWAKDLSSRSGLSGDARLLFVSDDKGGVSALDRSTGASLWRQDQLVGRVLSAPLAVGGRIVVGDNQGYVHVLARDTGALVGRESVDGGPITAQPIAIPGGFLVQTSRGGLAAFAAPTP